MKLNEASNMSTEDKMRAWAQGTRNENIRACGDIKLMDFANVLGRLAIEEINKNNTKLARTLANKLLDIANEHHARGNTSEEKAVQTAYQRTISQIDSIINSKNTQYQFAKNAFGIFQKLLADNKNEFDSMITMIDSLDSSTTYPARVTIRPNIVKDFINNYISLYSITENAFYRDFVVSDQYLRTVIDGNNCIVMDNTTNQCSYTEFGERIFAIYYLEALLVAQAAIFSKKVTTKCSSKDVYCGVSATMSYAYLDIDLHVSVPHNSLARCSIKIYFSDIRNTSLVDLQGQKVPVKITYDVYDSTQDIKTVTTTGDDIVTILKEFKTKLYSTL